MHLNQSSTSSLTESRATQSNPTRFERLIQAVRLLDSGRSFTVEDLERILGISRRTVFRDLKQLESSGLHLSYDNVRQAYRLERSISNHNATLSVREAFALIVLTRFFAYGRPDANCTGGGVGVKVEALLPRDMLVQCQKLFESVDVGYSMQGPSLEIDVLFSVMSAAANRNKITFRLSDESTKDHMDIVFRPYAILFQHLSWRVIGYSEHHQAMRAFNRSQLQETRVLMQTFTLPKGWSLSKYLRANPSTLSRDSHMRVRIRFSPSVANDVLDTARYPQQRTRRRSDGSLMLEAAVDTLDEVVPWVLSYGSEAHVLAPRSLKDLIVTHAQSLLDSYKNDLPAWASDDADNGHALRLQLSH